MAWSPSLTFKFFGVKIELGAEVGSVGGAFVFGLGINIDW